MAGVKWIVSLEATSTGDGAAIFLLREMATDRTENRFYPQWPKVVGRYS